MATLRAWERRYGFPDSERTTGGHRLYSERDVLFIRWVKARIDEGMQASHAINALRHQEETGALALVEPVTGIQDIKPVPIKTGESNLRNYEGQLFNALIHRELSAADTILVEALAASSPET
jgi:DNA-binding transcriptional MerR regulator